jgi:hypothetical protein
MNPNLEEILAEERRRDIIREMDGIRLEEQALKVRVYRPNWFTRTMQGFGEWLIARGEGLVKRYEIPGNRAPSSRQGYAH